MLYIPPGFGHGFCTLNENTVMLYKTSNHYNLKSEETIIWNDSDLNISWPKINIKPTISDKDNKGINFKKFISKF